MTEPEPRRIEPTGNPRVDALIDGLVCPSCRTIYNAAKAGCADLWHHDNQLPIATGGVVTWADAAELATASMREQEARRSALADREAAVSLDDVTMRYTKEDLDGARERGVAEGRCLAAAVLRTAAAGRRTYAESAGVTAGLLEAEAGLLDLAADAAGGDLKPLYGWLPSWQWTPEMAAALDEQRIRPWEPTEQTGVDRG